MAAQISTHAAQRTRALPLVGTSEDVLSAVPAWLSLALVSCVALAAGTGLLVPGFYRDAPTWVSQARGQDLVTLLVGIPLLVVGLIGARHGSVRCLLPWLGAVGYMAYATSLLALFNPLVEFTDIAMMRKCLLGIKRLAEASAPDIATAPVVA